MLLAMGLAGGYWDMVLAMGLAGSHSLGHGISN